MVKREVQTAGAVRKALRAQADPVRAKSVARFFKTGPGDYGEGDRFIGVTVPSQRLIARTFRDLTLDEVDVLLTSPIHEERLTALLILVDQFNRASRAHTDTVTSQRRRIFRLYMKRLRFINNWDLVDTSAGPIVGGWLAVQPEAGVLSRLARSKHPWSRRVAMIATFHGIARGDHREAIRIARMLVQDREDLMQKAVGWMLREVGKRASMPALERFLAQHAATMPRTMLRYAIERLPPSARRQWMTVRNRESG
jgi:3-methyladenine DNA glycosylase AlkD